MVSSTASPCSDLPALQRLLLGYSTGPETEVLEAHLASCDRCLKSANTLLFQDPLLRAMAVHGSEMAEPSPHQDLIDAVVPLLKRLFPDEIGRTILLPSAENAEQAGTPTWIKPAQEDGELGWLGPYRLLRQLGAGGMGVVYVAEDPKLRRQVAIKAIRPELLARPEMRERFLREARAVAAVEHDHIVAVHHVGEHEGVPYLTMPLLRGQTLEDRLRAANGPLPLEEILPIAFETAKGLAAAHARGLVHRDVKPTNLFLEAVDREKGFRVKILDFGLAQAIQEAEASAPSSWSLAGTPAYMSPEQGRGLPADARSDLFSLGCVLYQMATGHPAFHGTTMLATLTCVALDQPRPPRELNPKLPPALASLIESLLAKKPEERPASAEEVANALDEIQRQRAQAVRVKPWRRRWLILSAATIVFAVGMTAWLYAPEPAAQPPTEIASHAFHSGSVRAVAFSQVAGSRLALSAADQTIIGWLAGSAEKPWVLGEHQSPVNCLAVSRDGTLAASGSGGKGRRGNDFSIRLWDLEKREQVTELMGHENWVTAVAFAPNGLHLLSGGVDGTICLWDLKAKKLLDRIQEHDGQRVTAVAFSSDGKQALSAGGDNNLLLWNIEKKQVRRRLEGHTGTVTGATFSPDGDRIASCSVDGTLRLWDLASKAVHVIQIEKDGVNAIAWSPDGCRLLTGGEDGKVRLWDAKTEAELAVFLGHREAVQAVAFSADNLYALSGGADRAVRLWELPKQK